MPFPLDLAGLQDTPPHKAMYTVKLLRKRLRYPQSQYPSELTNPNPGYHVQPRFGSNKRLN